MSRHLPLRKHPKHPLPEQPLWPELKAPTLQNCWRGVGRSSLKKESPRPLAEKPVAEESPKPISKFRAVTNMIASLMAGGTSDDKKRAGDNEDVPERRPFFKSRKPKQDYAEQCKGVTYHRDRCCTLPKKQLDAMTALELKKHVFHYDEFVMKKKEIADANDIDFDVAVSTNDVFHDDLVSAILDKCTLREFHGIYNKNIECFAISGLQALMACPMFVDYVKKKIPKSELDFLMRTFVAQYLTRIGHVRISKILTSVVPDHSNKQDDAERFLLKLYEAYLDPNMYTVHATYKYTCTLCQKTSVTTQNESCLRLSWPPHVEGASSFFTISDLVRHTSINDSEILQKNCDLCGNDVCRRQITYEFSDILLVSAPPYTYHNVAPPSTHHNTGKKAVNIRSVHQIVDFTQFAHFDQLMAEESCELYKLAGIVYYRPSPAVSSAGTDDPGSSGHYVTKALNDMSAFVLDDMNVKSVEEGVIGLGSSDSRDFAPYFAIYYRVTRNGHFEEDDVDGPPERNENKPGPSQPSGSRGLSESSTSSGSSLSSGMPSLGKQRQSGWSRQV